MECRKYRLRTLRLINLLYLFVFMILDLLYQATFSTSFVFVRYDKWLVASLFIAVLLASFIKPIQNYYQTILYIFMWIVTIITADIAFLRGMSYMFEMHLLLLLITLFGIFNKRIVGVFIFLYSVSVMPVVFMSHIKLSSKLTYIIGVVILLALAYIKSQYDYWMYMLGQKADASRKSLLDNAQEAFALHEIIYDDNGKCVDYKFIMVNAAFEKLVGLSNDTIIGQDASRIVPHMKNAWLQNFTEVVIEKDKYQFTDFLKEEGRYYEVRAYYIDKNEFATLISDVTESFESKMKMEFAIKRIEMANELKMQFLKDVNHRLRTPLNGMMGMVQLINVEEVGEENKPFFEAMLMEMRHSRNILNQISKYLEIQNRRFEYGKANVFNIVKGEIERVSDDEATVEVVNKLSKEEFYLEKMVLVPVFRELVSNGLAHSKTNSLEVVMYDIYDDEGQKYVKIAVTDDGDGLTKEKMGYIFNEFYHDDFINIYKDVDKYSLAMCKQLMNNSGGNLIVESEEGFGAKFVMTVPVYTT